MPNLKQRLENLERSSAVDGQMSHEQRLLFLVDKPISPSAAAKPAPTDEEIDAFLWGTPNKREQHHANT